MLQIPKINLKKRNVLNETKKKKDLFSKNKRIFIHPSLPPQDFFLPSFLVFPLLCSHTRNRAIQSTVDTTFPEFMRSLIGGNEATTRDA